MKKDNFENFTKFIKNKNFILALCVFGLTMLTIGVSYASFFTVKTNTNNQTITTGDLSVSYSGSSTIRKEIIDIMPNDEGMNQSESSLIYIQNTGSLDTTYTLTIGYDMVDYGTNGSRDLTPVDYMMFAVYEYNGAGVDDTLVAGPLAIGDLPIYTYNSDSRYNRYSVLFDTLGNSSSGENTKTYKIKVWLSDKAIPSVSFTDFYVSLEIVAEVEGAKMKYNISGKITDGTDNLEGAIISLHNGSAIATTNASGDYTLNDIYPGVYNVDITYDNKVYSGNLTVEEGNTQELTSFGNTFTGNNIFEIANTKGTTISKIIKENGYTTYSSALSITSGKIMPSYKIKLSTNNNVNNVKFTIDTENNVYSMSW